MLKEITDLIVYSTGSAVDINDLPPDVSLRPTVPRTIAALARACCAQASKRQVVSNCRSVAKNGALDLIEFLAELPEEIASEIDEIETFAWEIERAWHEPKVNAFVGLCNTVHDVWSHLFAIEHEEDARIEAALATLTSATVLDYGSGAGHFALTLAASGATVDIVEIDPVKRDFLHFRARRAGLSGNIRDGIGREQYGLVLAMNLLDHLEDPVKTFVHLGALTRPEGYLAIQAQFPDDGWHQCNPLAIEGCRTLALRDFVPLGGTAEATVPWFDILVKLPSDSNLSVAGYCRDTPRLHVRTIFELGDNGTHVASSQSCLSMPCALNGTAVALCRDFDGTSTIPDLAQKHEMDELEIRRFVTFLCGYGLTFMSRRACEPIAPAWRST